MAALLKGDKGVKTAFSLLGWASPGIRLLHLFHLADNFHLFGISETWKRVAVLVARRPIAGRQ
jgi:hypothetical protein